MLAAGRHRHAHALVAQHALDVERAAAHGLERRDVLDTVQVVTLTLEALSLLDVNAHDEVTRAVATDAGLAVSLDLEGLAGVDAGRDFHLDGLVVGRAALPAAGLAGMVDGMSRTVADGHSDCVCICPRIVRWTVTTRPVPWQREHVVT